MKLLSSFIVALITASARCDDDKAPFNPGDGDRGLRVGDPVVFGPQPPLTSSRTFGINIVTTTPTITFGGPVGCGSGLPPIISDLRADPGDRQVTLYWSSPPNGACIRAYQVTAYPLSSGDERMLTAPSVYTTTSYSLTVRDLQNGVRYRFEVLALNDNGRSAIAATEATPYDISDGTQGGLFCLSGLTPGAPVNLRAQPRDGSVYVCWNGPRECVDEYEVEATPVGTAAFRMNNLLRSPGGCLEVKGLTNGVQYQITVTSTSRTLGQGGSSSIYATPRATPPPTGASSSGGGAWNLQDLANLAANGGFPEFFRGQ